jgi:peptidoglycan hydrolase-like protein with peptidoglycan-binding domain
LQQLLKHKGFKVGPIDGAMGPHTRQAAADFARRRGLNVAGELSLRMLESARKSNAR